MVLSFAIVCNEGSCHLLLTHGRGKRAHLAQAEEAADAVISIDVAGSVLMARVEKDPTMETTSLEFFNADGAQSTLEHYAV